MQTRKIVLINNVSYGKTMENLRNRINIRFVSNENYYLIWASKPRTYMSHKIFDNDLVTICKSKIALEFKKP